jgi:hypothetical protein
MNPLKRGVSKLTFNRNCDQKLGLKSGTRKKCCIIQIFLFKKENLKRTRKHL